MTANFRISDALRCMLVNAPRETNLAVPAETLGRDRPLRNSSLWRQSLSRSGDRVTIANWDGLELNGLVSARMRSGALAWEIDRLHLGGHFAEPGSVEGVAFDLLETVAQEIGCRRAERIFLRAPNGSPIVQAARRTGFFPCWDETLLRGKATGRATEADEESHEFGPCLPGDLFKLFQLYCAAVPQPVRSAAALTFERWKDAREQPKCDRQEWTAWHEDRLVGWLALDTYRTTRTTGGRTGAGQMLVRPDRPELAGKLLNLAAKQCLDQSWLIPDYQEPLASMLLRNGFIETGRYTVLIKTLAAPVMNHELSLAEA